MLKVVALKLRAIHRAQRRPPEQEIHLLFDVRMSMFGVPTKSTGLITGSVVA